MEIKTFGLDNMRILPPAPGKCAICADEHAAELPHNPYSLYYQMKFRQEHDRWPTWADAMEHCTDDVKTAVIQELKAKGIEV